MKTSTVPAESTLPAPILVVEDDPLIRRRLGSVLISLGYTEDAMIFAESLAQARAYLAQQPVAIALVDLGLPDGNGIELIGEMRSSDPAMGILVISAWSTEGATGYVLKERDDLEVSLSIRSVLRGGAPIDPFIARRVIAELQPAVPAAVQSPETTLTMREAQILQLVAEGLGNREIAEKLFLSRYTVECHVKHIYRKLAVSSRTRAVTEARVRGLLQQ